MRVLHILSLLVGVQLMINGVFFSSSLLTAIGASLICLFILLASKRSTTHASHGNHSDLGPRYHTPGTWSGQETYFAPLALLALIAGALAYLFGPFEDVYEKTAVTITATGLLYLLLAIFSHGFKETIKNIMGVLFSGLFLLGAVAVISLWRTTIETTTQAFLANLRTPAGITTGDNTLTVEQIAALSGNLISGTTITGEIVNIDQRLPYIPLTGTGDTPLTYGQLIMYIAQKYNMNADERPELDFALFPRHDNRYKAFKAAYYSRFFGTSVDPEKKASCDNYIVFVGLAEKRPLSYTAANVYDVFRAEAQKRGLLFGCKQGAFVKRANLF